MTWGSKWLDDNTMKIDQLNDAREFPIRFGEYIIDLLCGPEDEDDKADGNTNTGSSAGITLDSTSMEHSIFHNVCDLNLARQALRIFLMIRFVSRTGKTSIFYERNILC